MIPVLHELASAIDYIHSMGFVHCDIKPENILVDRNDHVKILDLETLLPINGIASDCMGTPFYTAPETWLNQPLTPSADQYSFAVVIYEALQKKLPFSDNDISRLKAHVLTENPPALSQKYQKFGPAIAKGLNKKPGDRYSSCLKLVETLEKSAKRTIFFPLTIILCSVVLIAMTTYIFYTTHNKDISTAPELKRDTKPMLFSKDQEKGIRSQPHPSEKTLPLQTKPSGSKNIKNHYVETINTPTHPTAQVAKMEKSIEYINNMSPAEDLNSRVMQNADVQSVKLKLAVRTGKRDNIFFAGEEVSLKVTVNKSCFIVVYVTQADGSEVILFPNHYNSNTKVAANSTIEVPGVDKPGFKIIASPPWGRDVIHVIASTQQKDIFAKISKLVQTSPRSFIQTKGLRIEMASPRQQIENGDAETTQIDLEIETRAGARQ